MDKSMGNSRRNWGCLLESNTGVVSLIVQLDAALRSCFYLSKGKLNKGELKEVCRLREQSVVRPPVLDFFG